ncbi:exodeoxyribonuclease VII large subunit [Algoriphagus lutimaris]|uniref:exodeoxyribonuclease VII large subunit n=1 Tax=Algoriphagus lutimaris TaxID=613197 RepID=UPI00196A3D9A|nr:exodeoxyribonuclease VII large subunit [Algoriphagus lutimaris]MBN3520058.1 exodeoxyribonuclease VII large subunit [Algoriphagus lutimaris]
MHNARSISELNQLIQQVIDTELDPVYWVVGEISDFRLSPQGHAYFEIVEKSGNKIQAKLRANLWAFTYRNIAAKFESVTGSSLKNGMNILAQVAINFHPLYGLSINVKDIDPSFSLGERARLRQETIDRLTKEGMISLNSQLEMPPVIQKIGIISSATAAGFGDFINQLNSNPGGYHIYYKLFPSLMQGNEASANLIRAIELAEESKESLGLEAIVIIRGGGAQLDLDCFDDYQLALKIAQCSLPVFTGIGHERDETIADLVAHTKLKTPTAVAEFLLSGFREFDEMLSLQIRRLDRSTRLQLQEQFTVLQGLSHRINSNCMNRLSRETDRLNANLNQIKSASKSLLQLENVKLSSLEKTITQEIEHTLVQESNRIERLSKTLSQLDPKSILERGYTKTEVNSVPVQLVDIKEGDQMITHTLTKTISSIITQIEE